MRARGCYELRLVSPTCTRRDSERHCERARDDAFHARSLPPRRRQIATLSDGASRESPAPRFGRAEDLI
eukprot:30043-Pelagococcus_subviridis.AAC.2